MSGLRPVAAARSFTIVETLVACAIVIVTAATVMSVYAAVRENSRRSACVGNLHQIHCALRMYADDWDGIEPRLGVRMSFSKMGLPPIPQGERLDVYLKSRSVWRCLNDPHDPRVYPRSYGVCFHEDFMIPGVQPFPERVAECGDRIPLYACPYHGYDQGVDFGMIVLRWNGSARWRNVIWPFTACMD